MEISSPQLAQAMAAARIALAEAFVLKVGQVLQAVVAGRAEGGLTLLKIGDQVVKAALPEPLPVGTTLQLQVKSAGSSPQLAIVAQRPPQMQAPVSQVQTRPELTAPAAAPRAEAASRPEAVGQNGESAARVSPTPSQGVSSSIPTVATVRLPVQLQPAGAPAPGQASTPAAPTAVMTPAVAVAAGQAEAAATLPGQAAQSVLPAAATATPPAVSLELVLQAPAPVAVGQPAAVSPTPLPATPQSFAVAEPVAAALAAAPSSAPAPGASNEAPAAARQSVVPAPAAAPAAPEEPALTHPLLVAQAAPRPPAMAAELGRAAMPPLPVAPQAGAAPSPPTATPQAALAQMLPEALARQDSPAPLLQSLAALVQKPAMLPEPVLRAALGVLAQRVVVSGGQVKAADIERTVLRSGLGLEATLARGEPSVPLDAKAGLLALRAALAKWLGDAPPLVTPRDPAPPPLRGLPLRAPEIDLPPLPEAPRDALRAVHGQADSAVSRLKLMQMASLPDADPARPAPPTLRLELPLLVGHELVMAQLQVSRDGARREAERKRGWTMRFALNFSTTGEVGAEVGLLGKAVNVALWAAEPETVEAMQEALPGLAASLEAIGLKPGALRIRRGVPEADTPASGQLLDSVS